MLFSSTVRVSRVVVLLAVAAAAGVSCRSAPSGAGGSGGSAVTAAPSTANYITSSPEAFRRRLPAPPQPGGAQELCEMQAILIAQAEVTTATRERVKVEESLAPAVFGGAAGRTLDQAGAPLTLAILSKALADTRTVSNQVKSAWMRPRPSTTERRITPLVELPTNSSYPSGHATLAVVWAGILAELAPDRRAELEQRARLVAWDRVVAGVHYPSDVAAGMVLGEAMVREMLGNEVLRRELDAARAEWSARP
jgi:hypothetical protein